MQIGDQRDHRADADGDMERQDQHAREGRGRDCELDPAQPGEPDEPCAIEKRPGRIEEERRHRRHGYSGNEGRGRGGEHEHEYRRKNGGQRRAGAGLVVRQ